MLTWVRVRVRVWVGVGVGVWVGVGVRVRVKVRVKVRVRVRVGVRVRVRLDDDDDVVDGADAHARVAAEGRVHRVVREARAVDVVERRDRHTAGRARVEDDESHLTHSV